MPTSFNHLTFVFLSEKEIRTWEFEQVRVWMRFYFLLFLSFFFLNTLLYCRIDFSLLRPWALLFNTIFQFQFLWTQNNFFSLNFCDGLSFRALRRVVFPYAGVKILGLNISFARKFEESLLAGKQISNLWIIGFDSSSGSALTVDGEV